MRTESLYCNFSNSFEISFDIQMRTKFSSISYSGFHLIKTKKPNRLYNINTDNLKKSN